ncbi:FCD domain-containing protein [Leptolyngbya ectocarpi]|uniref:FCD domain-containing protein n=1 Tax=Leptolyngbya ectocarpi TaxID=1202 RepID=UPI0038996506
MSSQPLHERVYLALRTSILSGELGLGERLNESQLAKQLEVSRTPIREAIRRLQQEQLLTTDSPDGITIVEISLDSAIHMYDCRIALEQLAVEGACRYATSAQLQALEQNLLDSEAIFKAQMGAAWPSDNNPELKQLELNYNFHRLIAESSQNPWLLSLLDQLSNQVKLLRLQILQVPIDVEAIHAEHWQLFHAIAKRDPEAATQSIRQHLKLSKMRVVQVFSHSQKDLKKAGSQSKILCPSCSSDSIKKNGRRQDKQNYLCKTCGRQFIGTSVSG